MALAKETFTPLAVALVVGWMLVEGHDSRTATRLGWLALLGVLGFATLTVLFSVGNGRVDGEPGVSRSLFNVFGPLLSLGSAITVSRLLPK